MLTLDSKLRLPEQVVFTFVGEDAILLNTRTNKYFALDDVGARVWHLLSEGKSLRDSYGIVLSEYEVDAGPLEQDLLELVNHLMENGLVEIVDA